MPCNAVATVATTIDLPLKDFAEFPAALDALAIAITGSQQVLYSQRFNEITLMVEGYEVQITERYGIRCARRDLAHRVKAGFETLQAAVILEYARQKIVQAARITQEQYVGESLVLTLDL